MALGIEVLVERVFLWFSDRHGNGQGPDLQPFFAPAAS
jgi:hypothetical protein